MPSRLSDVAPQRAADTCGEWDQHPPGGFAAAQADVGDEVQRRREAAVLDGAQVGASMSLDSS